MSSRTMAIALTLLVGLGLPQSIRAEDAPEKSIRYRHKSMEALGDHMSMASMILKGQISREADLASHARAMSDISKTLGDLWPAGTLENSDSKKEVWEDAPGFAAQIKTFQEATAAFLAATEKHDLAAATTAFDNVGKNCGGCHDKFRVEDED